MKHINKAALTLLAVIITLCIATNVYAVYDEQWKIAYTEEFDNSSHSFTQIDGSMGAEVSDGALDIKSDALCYFALNSPQSVNDKSNINSSINAKAMSLFNTKLVDKISERDDLTGSAWEGGAGTVNGYKFEYVGSGSNAMRIESIEDANGVSHWGFRSMTFINSDRYPAQTDAGNALRTSELRFVVNTGIFLSSENDYIVEVVYYNKTEGNTIQIRYPGTDGSEKTYAITGNELVTGEWTTVRIELSDADFTKLASGEKNSLKTIINSGSEVYFYSFAILRNSSELSWTSQSRVAQAKIDDTALYGHTRIAYDMTLPSDIAYNDRYSYNTGANSMRVSLANSEKSDVASIVYDILDDEAQISCLSGNTKIPLYSGSIIDRPLTYVIEIDDSAKTYTVQILEDETPLELDNSGPFDVAASNDIMYINIYHNPYSQALLSQFDNFEVSVRENLDTKLCAEDAYAISFDSLRVKNDFEIPLYGEYSGSNISWESSKPDVIFVDENAGMAYVNSAENECSVTLTATVSLGQATTERKFTFVVPGVEGVYPQAGAVTATSNKTGASVSVAYAGASGATQISFVAVSTASDKSLRDKKIDTQQVPSNKYARMSFAISGLNVQPGDTVAYYIWDQDGRSLVNNSPTPVTGLVVNERAGNIKFSWNECFDDNNKLTYMIYRNGVHIADCDENAYTDIDVESGKRYNYEIVAADTNDNKTTAQNASAASTSIPYVNPVGKSQTEIDANSDGLYMRYADDIARIAYTEYAEVTDADGVKSACRYAPANKFMSFYTLNTGMVDGNDTEVIILLTYLDTNGTLTLTYNGLIPEGQADKDVYQQYKKTICTMEGTNKWKKIAIRIDDANFRKGGTFSGCDFGINSNSNNSLYVKKVEVVRASLYD